MQKRIFLAISLPEDVKKRLFRFVEKEFGDLPVKWTRKENLHLTLNFLGYVAEENIPGICEDARKAADNSQAFELLFEKTESGPRPDSPKMIWATGEKSDALAKLKFQLEKTLGFQAREKKDFRPHITLGRIVGAKWKKIAPEPEVERSFVFSVPVSSFEIFESKFEKGKREYFVLESFSLK